LSVTMLLSVLSTYRNELREVGEVVIIGSETEARRDESSRTVGVGLRPGGVELDPPGGRNCACKSPAT
jgi:hypothetical protein